MDAGDTAPGCAAPQSEIDTKQIILDKFNFWKYLVIIGWDYEEGILFKLQKKRGEI